LRISIIKITKEVKHPLYFVFFLLLIDFHYIDIVTPVVGDIWHVGENVNVTFKPDTVNQTVAIFFFNKTETLADGYLNENHTVFNFTVPQEAYSGSNSSSLLIAVRRQDLYLQTVDSVVLQVL
jgi:hypothetical protein